MDGYDGGQIGIGIGGSESPKEENEIMRKCNMLSREIEKYADMSLSKVENGYLVRSRGKSFVFMDFTELIGWLKQKIGE